MYSSWRIFFHASIISAICLIFAGCTNSCSQKVSDTDSTLNVVLSANVKGLDPIYANDTYSNAVISNISETLLEYHYLKRPLELQPLLAESMPEVSDNGLTHTFKIKKGVKFHNNEAFENGIGRELKAQDFVYSWKRLADPRLQADGFWVFDGKIKGLNEWRDKVSAGEADYDTPIEGIEATDDYTLVIKLSKPYYQLHYVLAMGFTSPVAKEVVDKHGKEYLNHPVGTGPYKFANWVRNNKIELVKNENWHGQTYPTEGATGDEEAGLLADAGKTLPFNDKITFHEVTEAQPRWLNFMKGNYEYMGIPKDNFDSAIAEGDLTPEMKSKGVQLFKTPEPDVTYVAFNMKDPILGKNENLRKAIALAYDTKTSIEKFYNGQALPAQSPIPPSIDAYDPNFENPFKKFDVSKAKEFLEKAGFPEGKGAPVIEYSALTSSTARQMAEFFKQNMAAIGLQVKIDSVSWPQLQKKIKEAQAQMWGIAWLADYPDAENFLQLLYGPNKTPGPNGANFANSKFDELYKKAAILPPGPERTQLYQEMRDIFVNEMPWVPGVHRLGYYLRHGWIKNFKMHSIINNHFKYLRVDAKKRAELKAKL